MILLYTRMAINMKKDRISEAVIRRLPRYYRHLDDLHYNGIIRISSNSLGKKMGVTASQIRQDLSCFGEFGQQGYGYHVDELREEIGRILGIDQKHRLIIVGAGNLAHALILNFNFASTGFRLDAAFDVKPEIIGTEIGNIPIYSMEMLPAYMKQRKPDVAVLTVPRRVAQSTADLLIANGIRGIWNFTNLELHSTVPGIPFENVHFADSLLTLSYRINT